MLELIRLPTPNVKSGRLRIGTRHIGHVSVTGRSREPSPSINNKAFVTNQSSTNENYSTAVWIEAHRQCFWVA